MRRGLPPKHLREARPASKGPYLQVMRHEARTIHSQLRAAPGPLSSPCHLWTGAVNTAGAPVTRVSGVQAATATAVLSLAGHPVSRRTPITRDCGRTLCVRADHLRPVFHPVPQPVAVLDTPRSRSPRGRDPIKLTAESVRSIRFDYVHGGASVADLMDRHGVSRSMVTRILRGDRWSHITGGTDVYNAATDRARSRADEARLQYTRGLTQQQIAVHMGVSQASVSMYLNARTGNHQRKKPRKATA